MKHLVIIRHANPLSKTDDFAIAQALGRIGSVTRAPGAVPGATCFVVEHSRDPDAASIGLNAAATKASMAVASVTVSPYRMPDPPPEPEVGETRERFREEFIGAVSAYSELTYCAGWMGGIEEEIRSKTDPYFTVLALLADGYPRHDPNDPITNPDGSLRRFEESIRWEPLTAEERAHGAAVLAELTDPTNRTDPAS